MFEKGVFGEQLRYCCPFIGPELVYGLSKNKPVDVCERGIGMQIGSSASSRSAHRGEEQRSSLRKTGHGPAICARGYKCDNVTSPGAAV